MTTITALPTPPSRDDPANFAARGDAFMAALPTFVTETNTVAGEVNTNATNAGTSATTASNAATTATNYATKTDGYAASTDNSAKSWAIGGTGNGQPSAGDAKSWATVTGTTVAGGEYSSKEYAQGTTVSTGSAKQWATKTDTAVSGGEYSAKYHAQAAAASALTAVNAPGTSATSTSSLTIGTGSKSLTVQTGKSFVVGMSVKVANTASPTNWMHGDITDYDSGTGALTVNVTATNGSGTASTWTVSLSAPGAGDVTQIGTQTLTNKTLTSPVINSATGSLSAVTGSVSGIIINDGYTEEVFTVSGTTPAISPNNGSIQMWTLSGASTPTAGTWADGQSLILGVTAGANSVTWFSVTWSKIGGSGTAPTLTSSGVNWIVMWKVSGSIRASFLGTA